ncbi:hypothetical protein N0V90_002466 [Kalmusia sp. IMI 367209]|nr:hypothetical protein N0V90_002466 [Kalmusia sp. IMI 367209]
MSGSSFGLLLVYWLLQLFAPAIVSAKGLIEVDHLSDLGDEYNCPGGNIYFAAHPVDALLYQNPDLYHDIHTFKCTTLVVFTTGDRGSKDFNLTSSFEQGLEAAYTYMAGAPVNETGWDGIKVSCQDKLITLRYPKDAMGLLIVYLRFPDGASDGQGYKETGEISLKKLYQNRIQTVTSLDGEATYNLNGLKDLVAVIIEWKSPRAIRILDYKTAIAGDHDYNSEHADHSVSARIVADAVKQYNIGSNMTGYAGNLMRSFEPTLQTGDPDFEVKSRAFFAYAKFDQDMCKSYSQCFKDSGLQPKEIPDDVKFTVEYLDREYYVV